MNIFINLIKLVKTSKMTFYSLIINSNNVFIHCNPYMFNRRNKDGLIQSYMSRGSLDITEFESITYSHGSRINVDLSRVLENFVNDSTLLLLKFRYGKTLPLTFIKDKSTGKANVTVKGHL